MDKPEDEAKGWLKEDSELLVDMSSEELEEYFQNLIKLVMHEGTEH